MTDRATRARPDGLAASGIALWDAVAGVLALDEHEAIALREICRTADTLDALQAEVDRDGRTIESPQGMKSHPALVELRAQRVTYARLVAALRLPAGLADRKAAAAGTGRPQRRSGVRGTYAIGGDES